MANALSLLLTSAGIYIVAVLLIIAFICCCCWVHDVTLSVRHWYKYQNGNNKETVSAKDVNCGENGGAAFTSSSESGLNSSGKKSSTSSSGYSTGYSGDYYYYSYTYPNAQPRHAGNAAEGQYNFQHQKRDAEPDGEIPDVRLDIDNLSMD